MPEFIFTAVAGCPHLKHLAFLKRWLPKAVRHIKRAPAEIGISLVGDTKMAALHEEFLDIPGPTDVLTFELDHAPDGRVIAGEVVVCVPYARREASRRGHDPNRELLLYALHGVLHLCGYDDRTDADHARMHAEEDRILHKIGIGATFSPARAGLQSRRKRRV